MMNPEQKLPYLEYFTTLLIKWHKDETGSNENDLSTLKVLKLLFFTSAVNTKANSQNTLLDTVFDNYVAMPYGHVESDVYNLIRKNQLVNLTINNHRSSIIKNFEISDDAAYKEIKQSVNSLRKINKNLIKASSFDLVDLSHTYYSWQYYYNKAKKLGTYSCPIPVEVIKDEEKFFVI